MSRKQGPCSRRRRPLLGLVAVVLAACTPAAQASSLVMFRDPQCGCCEQWAEHIRASLEHEVQVREDRPMQQVKTEMGLPEDLRSCHTMEIEGYVIEGHVPAREIARLLAGRPEGVEGLAVTGMPLGSPGMEADGRTQPYQVIAFGAGRQEVFALYP